MRTDHAETGSRPAPGRLALVQAFVNTFDIESGDDALAQPPGLRDWLMRQDLLEEDAALTDAQVARTIGLREALRAVLISHQDGDVPIDVVDRLNDVAGAAPLTIVFAADGTTTLHQARGGLDGAIAEILARVHDATIDGTWARLKVCRNDRCRWAFYDHSKNRSSSWCTMAICGNRMKSRAYRERRSRDMSSRR